ELAFRMMLRKHGAHLCFSPMIHAQLFVTDATYRRTALSTCLDDRPLVSSVHGGWQQWIYPTRGETCYVRGKSTRT
ncbi:hypothetical protein WUBG_18361, partial [Wuchereria bancrofti]